MLFILFSHMLGFYFFREEALAYYKMESNMLFILFSHMLGFYFFREEAMCELANVTVGIVISLEKKL